MMIFRSWRSDRRLRGGAGDSGGGRGWIIRRAGRFAAAAPPAPSAATRATELLLNAPRLHRAPAAKKNSLYSLNANLFDLSFEKLAEISRRDDSLRRVALGVLGG
jgi:hypothetical protein